MPKKENQLSTKFLSLRPVLRNILIFCATFIYCFNGTLNHALAQQGNIYLVESISAQASAKSSGEAKVLATTDARRNAFTVLLSRLSINKKIANETSDDDIFDMVNSEQITEEKISGSSYYATFNIVFSKNIVERVLKEKNVTKAEISREHYLVIPVKILEQKPLETNEPDQFLLWEAENDWKSAIEKEIENQSFGQFVVPESDLNNITSLNKDNIDQVSFEELEPLFSKYKSSEGLVMFFSYDRIENKVTILVQDIRKLQKKRVKLGFVNIDRLSYDSLVRKVAEKTLEYLSELKSNISNSESNFIRVEVPISSLGNWIMIKNKVESSGLINQLNIESMSKDYVIISINYTENQTDIIEAFDKKGIHLKRKSDSLFSLSLPLF